jgi:hypothetical protein
MAVVRKEAFLQRVNSKSGGRKYSTGKEETPQAGALLVRIDRLALAWEGPTTKLQVRGSEQKLIHE